jgi:hypothetical protein
VAAPRTWGPPTGHDYAYCAGPVKVTGTKSRCIAAYSYITDPFNTNRYSEITGINIGCATTPSVARL